MKKKKIPLYKAQPGTKVWVEVEITFTTNGTFVAGYTLDKEGNKYLASIHGLTEARLHE